ncbi:MAG: Na/Pi cotransporter family protein [Planctomycetota bacterium]|nr:Na/Pi cotransporter family protein [Planctomycetota bacterium]
MNDFFFALTKLLGGLGLFIYAMELMSQALQKGAGSKLRGLLQRVTENRWNGLFAGTSLSFLVHSSAATVMIVGFLSAGLMTFTRSIPFMLGANIGTTLSMQLISFKIGKFCYLAIALGLLSSKIFKREILVQSGRAFLGFGLLFLGMSLMSSAISPLKDVQSLNQSGALENSIQWISGATITGLIIGILFWSLFTSIIQSSGATLAICFTLCTQNLFTSFDDLFPCLLGAHIGTCVTAALGSLGGNFRAKRMALAHFVFNVFSTVLACILFELYKYTMPMLGGDLIRQAANANTVIQVSAALLILPFSRTYARFIKKIGPFKKDGMQKSFLDDSLLDTPEMALVAVIKEIRRVSRMNRTMLEISMKSLLAVDTKDLLSVRKMQEALDVLNQSVNHYLLGLAERELSERQSLLVQYLGSCMRSFKRTGDHIETLSQLIDQKIARDIWFDNDDVRRLVVLYKSADRILKLVARSLKPLSSKTESALEALSKEQELYYSESIAIRESFQRRVLDKQFDPLQGIYFNNFLNCFDRVAKHSLAVAEMKKKPLFVVKAEKFELESPKLDLSNPVPIAERNPYGEGKTLEELIKEIEIERKASAKVRAVQVPADVTSAVDVTPEEIPESSGETPAKTKAETTETKAETTETKATTLKEAPSQE